MKQILFAAIASTALLGAAAMAQTTGTTSGPAAGSPTTLGTGGQTPAVGAQTEPLRNNGGRAMTREHKGQRGGATAGQSKPHGKQGKAGSSHAKARKQGPATE